MTNLCAAIGVAQLERLPEILARKRALAAHYRRLLETAPVSFQQRCPGVESSDWLVSVLLHEGIDRDRVMALMEQGGVETRPVFYCAHSMPMYARAEEFPVAESIARRGISLPSYPQLSTEEVESVARVLRAAIGQARS